MKSLNRSYSVISMDTEINHITENLILENKNYVEK